MRAKLIRRAAICLIAAALAACGGAEERKAEHLEKAVKYFDQENLEKASVEFKNVLQIDPKLAKPYFYLGRIEEKKKNWNDAFGLYHKAVELDPDYRDAQLKLAQFFLLANDVNKASELVEAVAREKPTDIDVRMLRVAISNRKGESEAALADLEKIVAEKPARTEPYIVLAAFYVEKSKMPEAEKVLRDGLATNPKNPELLNSLVRFYLQQKQAEPAEAAVKELIAAQPNLLAHRALLARLYMQLGRQDETEQVLRAAMKDFPADPAPPTMLAEIFFKRGDLTRSESELKTAIAANPNEVKLYSALAQLLEQTKRTDQAEKLYRDFIAAAESKPAELNAKNLLAALLFRQGRADESQTLLAEVLADNANDHDALLLQGKLALANKKAQDAISSFRSILKDQPDATEVLTLLASAYQLDGKPSLAQENLEKAVTAKPDDFALRKNLVGFLSGQKNFSLALEKVDEFLQQKPNSFEGLNLKADVLAVSQQPGPLETVLKQIKSSFPDNATGPFRLGGLYFSQKKYDEALNEYEATVKLSKDDYEPLKSIAATYLQMKQPEKALARIRKAIADNPKNAGAYQVLATLDINQNRTDDAIKALKTAMESNPRWLLPYLNLAEIYEKKGEVDQALQIYRQALNVSPDEPIMLLNLARLYEGRKDYAKAIEQYENLLKTQPDNLVAINNLASLLSLDSSDKPSLSRAFALAKRLENSEQPAFLDTLAWIYYQTGDLDKALPLGLRAAEKFSNAPIIQYHLGMIYHRKGDAAKARDLLTKAIQSKQDFPGLQEARDVLNTLESAR